VECQLLRKALNDLYLQISESKKLELFEDSASQLLHVFSLRTESPKIQFESALLIFSLDVDVGNRKVGVINRGRNDRHVHDFYPESLVGEIEEQALPLLVDMFNDFKIPVTFAVRGQLTEVDDDSFLPLLLNSPVKHDIGAHGYSHRKFSDMSHDEAKSELNKLSDGMEKFGIVPRSFVFPRQAVSHLDLLKEFGYECFRAEGRLLKDGMYIEEVEGLYDVHPSLLLTKNSKAAILKKIVDIAVKKRMPLHFWFHPWEFGETVVNIKRKIEDFFVPLLDHAKSKEEIQELEFETMLSAARRASRVFRDPQLVGG
jgi:peptidoglycan/xylan/chitin deacetylase (PgdA/CDA1 family)